MPGVLLDHSAGGEALPQRALQSYQRSGRPGMRNVRRDFNPEPASYHVFREMKVRTGCRVTLGLLLPGILICPACNVFYDEGARFANQVADFAEMFRNSRETTAVFEYVPLYGTNQHVRVGIGRIRWCPKPPCDGSWSERLPSGEYENHYQGSATVWVVRGKSGTGYRIAAVASVPAPLEVEKQGGAIRVHMRKAANVIEIIALD